LHEVRVAVVGEQELHRMVGQRDLEGVRDDVEDLGLALGHLERVE
jgi:hypothetical protein